MTDVVVAVDGGGSKTDAVALTREGDLVVHRRGPGSSPHMEGLAESVTIVDDLVRAVSNGHGVVQVSLYLSGLDLPVEISRYADEVAGLDWAAEPTVVENDIYALLRTGTHEPDAVAVVCGTGVNAVGVRPGHADVRFPALGGISGDWGGGGGLGHEALWHAARDVDGRGPGTALTAAILRMLDVASIPELIEQLHFGRRRFEELTDLAPVIFEAARSGDAVAGRIVDRQAEEIVALARASLTRLELSAQPVPVVLGGGIIRAGDERLLGGIASGLAAAAPASRIVVVDRAPIVGAALLALGHVGADASALARAEGAVTSATRRSRPVGAV